LFLLFGLTFPPILTFGEEAKRAIDPDADGVLKEMGEYLKATKQFTFQGNATFDQVFDSAQKLQYSASMNVSVRRPNRFQVNRKGDLVNQRLWYDGKSITLLNVEEKLYARVDAPSKIDQALEFAVERFGIRAPLASLVLNDPYERLIHNVKSGVYVGSHEIDGVKTHHLAFTQENIDWQIWVEDGKMLVPRKVVITYKKVKSCPQFTAVLSNWDLSPRLPERLFTFVPTDEYEQIEFLPVEDENP